MSQTANTSSPPMSALGLLGRLLTARGRNRADLCYEFMGTRNCPSTDCTYLNLGYWRGTNEYPKAAEAMVDLLAEYEAAGFALDARELPDHLPLFLEYLSTRDEQDIGRWLGEISHILALLTARLEERNARHALVPHALLALIGATEQIDQHRPAVATEEPDHTPQALDQVWEEEVVRFSATSDEDCALQSAEGRRLAERKYASTPQVVNVMPASPSSPATDSHQ
jgi:nitrate reductase delta subunit